MRRRFVEPESSVEKYPDSVKNEPYVAEVKADGAVFVGEMVARTDGPNMMPRPRRACAMLLMSKDATYSRHRSGLPDELAENLRVGDVIPHHEPLPLLFSYGSNIPTLRA